MLAQQLQERPALSASPEDAIYHYAAIITGSFEAICKCDLVTHIGWEVAAHKQE
jgi:hypothetical protein